MGESLGGQIVVYEAPDGEVRVNVRLDRDTVWLSQEQMAELFGREGSVVTKHIRNVFQEGELEPEAVRAEFAHTAADGMSAQVEHYDFVIKDHPFSDRDERGALLPQLVSGEIRVRDTEVMVQSLA